MLGAVADASSHPQIRAFLTIRLPCPRQAPRQAPRGRRTGSLTAVTGMGTVVAERHCAEPQRAGASSATAQRAADFAVSIWHVNRLIFGEFIRLLKPCR